MCQNWARIRPMLPASVWIWPGSGTLCHIGRAMHQHNLVAIVPLHRICFNFYRMDGGSSPMFAHEQTRCRMANCMKVCDCAEINSLAPGNFFHSTNNFRYNSLSMWRTFAIQNMLRMILMINIRLSDGLVPPGIKQSPDPIFIKITDPLWYHRGQWVNASLKQWPSAQYQISVCYENVRPQPWQETEYYCYLGYKFLPETVSQTACLGGIVIIQLPPNHIWETDFVYSILFQKHFHQICLQRCVHCISNGTCDRLK